MPPFRKYDLSPEVVVRIREQYATDERATITTLSKAHKITPQAVWRIVRGTSYRDAGGPITIAPKLPHGKAPRKISPEEVAYIRYDCTDKIPAEIGRELGRSTAMISKILQGEHRKDSSRQMALLFPELTVSVPVFREKRNRTLSNDEVREMRELRHAKRISLEKLGERYGIAFGLARDICRGHFYKDAGGPIGPLKEKIRRTDMKPETVVWIKEQLCSGRTDFWISKTLGIQTGSVRAIRFERSWKDIPWPAWGNVKEVQRKSRSTRSGYRSWAVAPKNLEQRVKELKASEGKKGKDGTRRCCTIGASLPG